MGYKDNKTRHFPETNGYLALPPKAAKPNKHSFLENVFLGGFGTPGLQKNTWPKDLFGIPLNISYDTLPNKTSGPDIVDLGGLLSGPLLPQNHWKRWAAKPPTFSNMFCGKGGLFGPPKWTISGPEILLQPKTKMQNG